MVLIDYGFLVCQYPIDKAHSPIKLPGCSEDGTELQSIYCFSSQKPHTYSWMASFLCKNAAILITSLGHGSLIFAGGSHIWHMSGCSCRSCISATMATPSNGLLTKTSEKLPPGLWWSILTSTMAGWTWIYGSAFHNLSIVSSPFVGDMIKDRRQWKLPPCTSRP